MPHVQTSCLLCQHEAGDAQLERVEVWRDAHWRLTASLQAEVPAFSYLEPLRHIPSISELDGDEARTFGQVMARVTAALREATGAERVYVYIFGGSIPHLHVHLAPHRAGDALNDQMIRGEIVSERLESGAERIVSKDFPPLPEHVQQAARERLRALLYAS